MTHFGNYGNDRLALYTFQALADFVYTWTNLRMVTVPPAEMAERYFEFWPEDVTPIWQVFSNVIFVFCINYFVLNFQVVLEFFGIDGNNIC